MYIHEMLASSISNWAAHHYCTVLLGQIIIMNMYMLFILHWVNVSWWIYDHLIMSCLITVTFISNITPHINEYITILYHYTIQQLFTYLLTHSLTHQGVVLSQGTLGTQCKILLKFVHVLCFVLQLQYVQKCNKIIVIYWKLLPVGWLVWT